MKQLLIQFLILSIATPSFAGPVKRPSEEFAEKLGTSEIPLSILRPYEDARKLNGLIQHLDELDQKAEAAMEKVAAAVVAKKGIAEIQDLAVDAETELLRHLNAVEKSMLKSFPYLEANPGFKKAYDQFLDDRHLWLEQRHGLLALYTDGKPDKVFAPDLEPRTMRMLKNKQFLLQSQIGPALLNYHHATNQVEAAKVEREGILNQLAKNKRMLKYLVAGGAALGIGAIIYESLNHSDAGEGVQVIHPQATEEPSTAN